MKDIEKLVKKAVKKIGDPQARWFYGVEYSHDANPDWRVRIIPTKTGCESLVIGGDTEQELVDQLKDFIKNGDPVPLAIQYCNHEITLHEQAISFNKNVIKEYEKKNEDTSS